MELLKALFLGLVEGLTEFIPVSSTGHLLLLARFLGFESPNGTFEVLIQLGAILAILSVYFGKLWSVTTRLPSDPSARHFVLSILIAFLPAVVLGVALHKIIKEVFFASPELICSSLIFGGVVLLAMDRFAPKATIHDVTEITLPKALIIGLFQCLAMVPGMSRSGSTIVGSMLLGIDKRTAAEFSFFLAMPTMAGAFAYDLYKSADQINLDQAQLILVGFIAAFISGIFVVRWLLDYVSKKGFALFAWWRILVGLIGFGLIYMGY